MNITRVRNKLSSGERLKVLFLNDVGFQYGAGLAQLRQIQSFLLMGHEVKGMCWTQGPEGDIPFIPHNATGFWTGMRQFPKAHPDKGYSEAEIIRSILHEIISFRPEIIIVGNLHNAKWPLRLLLALRDLDAVVVAYMHDCFLVSGRCAYPADCRLYEVGCNETCPTANEYPVLQSSQIANEWKLRREIFCGPNGVFLAANSRWTCNMAERSMDGLHYADVVYYGIDDQLFKPIDRNLARRMLGIPEDHFVILSGAVNVSDRRKGFHFIKEVVSALNKEAVFYVFGQESSDMEGVRATGLLRDYRKMPLMYSAADLFVGTALEEAFGLTLCEASACGLPIVAFKVGGIPEIARHDISARLIEDFSLPELIKEIKFFMSNPQERQAFGERGRAIVESEFSLKRQAARWMEYLKRVVEL